MALEQDRPQTRVEGEMPDPRNTTFSILEGPNNFRFIQMYSDCFGIGICMNMSVPQAKQFLAGLQEAINQAEKRIITMPGNGRGKI